MRPITPGPSAATSRTVCRTLDDLPLSAIGDIVASTPLEVFLARYEASRRGGKR